MSDIVVICPDTNIELAADSVERGAIRGGKSAIVQLASAWGRAGHTVTLFAGLARASTLGRVTVRPLDECEGHYDVAVYVTGALGHFRDPLITRVSADVNVFWINGPLQVEPPPVDRLHCSVAPAKFLARRAVDDWGLPAERVVVIPGEAVLHRQREAAPEGRDLRRGVYASFPNKGLWEAVDVLGRCEAQGVASALDVFGSPELWGLDAALFDSLPPSARMLGDVPESDLALRMGRYGFMPYFTAWLDGFSLATAEAMAAGVIVFVTAHGSNAEFVRHGWNGFLIRAVDGRPDLGQAEYLMAHYLREPERFDSIRENARLSVPTWDEQAAEWVRAWES
jgi:glycosyltransferase involved in cell wall biosynthesis